jgi:hypothetical protein
MVNSLPVGSQQYRVQGTGFIDNTTGVLDIALIRATGFSR